MHFIDTVNVTIQAGDGGNGKLSFRTEKFVSKGGPDGGDGGHGANVILMASRNQNTLAQFRFKKEITAPAGQPGGTSNMHGRSGVHRIVQVPVGTVVSRDGVVIADLAVDGQQAIVAQGGRGGFGNAHFVSSRRQAPNFAEKGEPGESFDCSFELKMIADVALVGLPNAGKSTLISRISNAKPEIADYPFTTIRPNLGMVPIDDDTTVLFADVPGLIAGAADGKGLGHDFLRHVERTSVIVHLVDAYNDDVAEAYQVIRRELEAYKTDLSERPEIVALTKIEGLDDDIVADLQQQLQQVTTSKTPVMAISAQAGTGLSALLYAVKAVVQARQATVAAVEAADTTPVLTLPDTSAQWRVSKQDGVFLVTGRKIERFGLRTDFSSQEGLQRLRDIMRKMGIMHQLRRDGVEAGDKVRIGAAGSFEY